MSTAQPVKKTARLRALFESSETVTMPMGALPIHAQMAQHAGFEAFQLSGAFTAFWAFGMPDAGLLTLTEMVDAARRVVHAVDIPIYADADTGYGGPINVQRTVQEYIHAGVAGIHIEDQVNPKKAGGQAGIAIVSDEEAIGRLNAAADARDALDPDFVLVARTDGYGTADGGLEEAIRRGQLYAEQTGADVIFYEGLKTWDEVEIALQETPGPAYAIPDVNIGRRPSREVLSRMGQSIDTTYFIQPGVSEVWRLLAEIRDRGDSSPLDDYLERAAADIEVYRNVGHGDRLVSPSYTDVRKIEELYLPRAQQRDYADQ